MIGFSDGTQAEDWGTFYSDGVQKVDREQEGYSRNVVHSIQKIRGDEDGQDKPDSLVPGMVPNPYQRGWVPYAQNNQTQSDAESDVTQVKSKSKQPGPSPDETLKWLDVLEAMPKSQLDEVMKAAKTAKQTDAQALIQREMNIRTYTEGKGVPEMGSGLSGIMGELLNRTEGFEAPQGLGSKDSHVPFGQTDPGNWNYPKQFKSEKEYNLWLNGKLPWQDDNTYRTENRDEEQDPKDI